MRAAGISFLAICAGALLAVRVCSLAAAAGPGAIEIEVNADDAIADYKPVWNYFGADEPNYTYAANGTALLRELSQISPAVPVYFRAHNLLTSGNGQGSLKWGSTNVYSEAPDGTPRYDWKITDQLFDNLRRTNIRPLVEIGFMPEALSPNPTPYRHSFPDNQNVFTGWSYPPKDYAKWQALIVAWVDHLRQRYGAAVATWQWEVWNEPDIPYFHGTADEYFKLYDITSNAVRQVLPQATVGGPASTGPSEKNTFLRAFLEHCAHGKNAATGKPGVPLDFISFHPKGAPKFVEGHVRMGLAAQLRATDRGMQIVRSFPEYQNTPILLTETDPEGCAACQGAQNGYRNGALYGVSVAEMLARSAELGRLRGVNLAGAVTWAFEFEDQPWFAGFRELATNGVDKPVLNVFRLFGKLEGKQLAVTSSRARSVGDMEATAGDATQSDIGALATRRNRETDILIWNYNDDDVAGPVADISLRLNGIPAKKAHALQYRVDHDHSNAYTAWQAMGSPQAPTSEQLGAIRAASSLEILEEKDVTRHGDGFLMTTGLPRQGVSLYRITW